MPEAPLTDKPDSAAAVPSGAAVAEHIRRLLFDAAPPELTDPALAGLAGFPDLHRYLLALRDILDQHSRGDFTRDIGLRGVLGGRLKALQAHLQHLIWQMQQVMAGDFSQRVDFMGEFSVVFNSMVVRLDDALKALKQNELELVKLTQELESEVSRRGTALMEIRRREMTSRTLNDNAIPGVMDRGAFVERVLSEVAKCEAGNRHCCLAMMEVNDVFELSDRYGASAGDLAVRRVVDVAKNRLRHWDVIARYSGNSFAIFISDADERQAERMVERIESAVASAPLHLAVMSLKLSASIGMAVIPPGVSNAGAVVVLKHALHLADMALLQARDSGLGHVILSIDSPAYR